MSTEPNEELQFSNMRPRRKSSAKKNLEFDFQDDSKYMPSSQIKLTPPNKTHASTESNSLPVGNQSLQSEISSSSPPITDPLSQKSMSTSPAFSQFQQNVQRQTREQKAVGSLLSGMAIILITCILLVAILASFGGYALYRQIQHQSATVSELDSKLTAEIVVLANNLKENSVVLDGLSAQYQGLKQQAAGLQSQIEDIRAQAKKAVASEQAKRQKLENRVYDLERQALSK